MNLRINEDPAASAPVRRLSEAHQATARSLERLASGQRVNRAADDPGALVTSETLRAEIASIRQAVRNTEVSISTIQTAEGALAEVNNLLIEIRQTALAAANSGAGDFVELSGLQSELRYALEGIDRVSRFTRFGNRPLLDGSQGVTGVGNSDDLTFVSATEQTRSSPVEGYPVVVTQLPLQAKLVGDLTDSDADGLRVILEEEDGGLVDVSNVAGAGAPTFVSRLQRAAEGVNLDLIIHYDEEESELTITHQEYGLAKGFMLTTSKQGVLGSESYAPKLFYGQDVEASVAGEAMEGDGVHLTGYDHNAQTAGLHLSYTGDQLGEVGTVTVFQNAMRFQIGPAPTNSVDVAIRSTASGSLSQGVPNESGFRNLSEVNVYTPRAATDTVRLVDEAVNQVSSMRAHLGVIQRNTLESSTSNLRVAEENLTAAESSLRDTDLALELAQFTKGKIMLEVAAATVAQANRVRESVVRTLLRDPE